MLNWFKKNNNKINQPLKVDIHSHLLAGLDDGVKSLEQAEEIILFFKSLGYSKLITTPHVMQDVYKNTPSGILEKLLILKNHLDSRNITFEIEAAAEYYLDETLMECVHKDKHLLTFGKNYLLFETNFVTEPLNLKEFIFIAATKGYRLILAHPERYLYLQNDLSKAEDLINRGVLFQVNMSSLTGYYSKGAQRTAEKLIDRGWIHWLGSDCHHLQHAQLMKQALHLKYFRKAVDLPLLNNSL